jgi:hypothetical protein
VRGAVSNVNAVETHSVALEHELDHLVDLVDAPLRERRGGDALEALPAERSFRSTDRPKSSLVEDLRAGAERVRAWRLALPRPVRKTLSRQLPAPAFAFRSLSLPPARATVSPVRDVRAHSVVLEQELDHLVELVEAPLSERGGGHALEGVSAEPSFRSTPDRRKPPSIEDVRAGAERIRARLALRRPVRKTLGRQLPAPAFALGRLALPTARAVLYIAVAAGSFTIVSWLSSHWAP